MPTIHRLTNASIYIYAADHAPPHFHLVGPDSNVQVRIDTLQIIRGRCRRRDLAEAVEWATLNREYLLDRWNEINERG